MLIVDKLREKNKLFVAEQSVAKIIALSTIESNAMDFVALGRQSICDPHFPRKVKEGRINEILTCTGCM